MTATVRLDEKLEFKLNNLANTLHKKKSDKRRVAGAKVVDGDLDPLLAQGVEDLDAALHVQHQHGFGQLQRQQARLDLGLPELLRHLPRQGAGELEAGEVDRHRPSWSIPSAFQCQWTRHHRRHRCTRSSGSCHSRRLPLPAT